MKQHIKDLLKKLQSKSSNPNKNAKKEQLKTIGILTFFIVFGVGFYFYTTIDGAKPKKTHNGKFAGVFDNHVGADYDHASVEALNNRLDAYSSKLNKLEIKQNKPHTITQTTDANMLKQLEALKKEVDHLKEHKSKIITIKPKKATPIHPHESHEDDNAFAKAPSKFEQYQPQSQTPLMNTIGIEDVSIQYPESKKQDQRTSKNYVWAGTFATGYLMTGIVGDAGTNSTKNRGTVAIKITGTGTMPNGQYSHLRNCVVLGSTYGDLSSDSDVIHLETLSCAGKKYSFEKKVYGSVFDLDAMQDLRGIPVLKAKPILGYATVAGLIAGIGDGLSSSGQTSSVTGAGVVTTPTSVMKSGLGQGISKPADKITDYLMNIANMYHPIVVAHAGRKVTVLFQAGFFIDKAHNSYDSMKSINTTHHHGTQEQSQIKHEKINPDTLTQNIQKASGNVTDIAQKQASTQFDHRVNLGGGLFEPIQK
jgi:conjugal transfer pilus assembly protein TraB